MCFCRGITNYSTEVDISAVSYTFDEHYCNDIITDTTNHFIISVNGNKFVPVVTVSHY